MADTDRALETDGAAASDPYCWLFVNYESEAACVVGKLMLMYGEGDGVRER